MTDEKEAQFLELLVKKDIVSQAKLDDIRSLALNSKRKVEDFLIEQKILNSEKIVEIKAEMANMSYRDTSGMLISESALNVIPFEVAQNYRIACFEKAGSKIKVGLVDPYNSKAIEAVNFLAQEQDLEVEYYLISEENLNNLFTQHRNLEKEISTALETKAREGTDTSEVMEEDSTEDLSIDENVTTAPVARIVSVIIRHAVEEKASDIHIEPMSRETRVRYRIDGILRTSLVLPKSIHPAVVSRIKVLSKLKLDETRVPQDGRIRLMINKKEIDFRISVMPLMGEEKVVMRILDLGRGIPPLEELGYSHRALDVIKQNIKKTFGLLLITGPTGSGKSTTLASVLNMLNDEKVNIVTLEDPVEYYIKGANQSQIRPSIGYTFASGLRSILRQDPDIVMVGEIRDNETAELSIHAGLTGHFVLSTLHTNNAIDVVPRLLDMKVEPFLLASTLNTVVAQRLARRICVNCKRRAKISPALLEKIKEDMKKMPQYMIKERLKGVETSEDITEDMFFEGEGCPHCKNTGYSGRVAVVEVIDFTEKMQKVIMDPNQRLTDDVIRADQDYITMKEDGYIKVLQGFTTIQEVLRVIQD
jgi:type IV pilus assembly protein PilB